MIRSVQGLGVDLIGEPRLVRLNPNVPWKTRGNAALSARFGRGRGRRYLVGDFGDGPVHGYPQGRALQTGIVRLAAEAAWEAVRSSSRRGDPGTDPALVVTSRRLPADLYWRAVSSVVPLEDVRRSLDQAGALTYSEGSDRGLVGAAASIAWPGRRATWELIAYRRPGTEGRERAVDRSSVEQTARDHPSLFLCTDPRTRRLLVVPHTRCPILYGLRSTRRVPLLGARRTIVSEPVGRWSVFRTNQGTGDHLAPRRADELEPFSAAVLTGWLGTAPQSLRGGHVRFELETEGGSRIPCIVFEPSKTLTRVARALAPGDRLRLWGGRAADPAFRVEGIVIRSVGPRATRHGRACHLCGRATHSLGRVRGYRCRGCGARIPPESYRYAGAEAVFGPGVYHPTPSARRHLHPRGPEGWEFAVRSISSRPLYTGTLR